MSGVSNIDEMKLNLMKLKAIEVKLSEVEWKVSEAALADPEERRDERAPHEGLPKAMGFAPFKQYLL